jgi:hypothetical protein
LVTFYNCINVCYFHFFSNILNRYMICHSFCIPCTVCRNTFFPSFFLLLSSCLMFRSI